MQNYGKKNYRATFFTKKLNISGILQNPRIFGGF